MSGNHLDSIELRSEEVQEILTKVPHWLIRWGSIIFLFLIIIIFGLSWLIKYPDIIVSEAYITTQNPPQKEFAKISGKIQALLVEDNQKVTHNQVLAILENTANYKDVYKLKSIIDTIAINHESFNFPSNNLKIMFLGDIESSFAVFESYYTQYQLSKKLRPFSYEISANEITILELNRQLQNLKSQQRISELELKLKLKDLNRQKVLFEKGVISAQNYENKELEYTRELRNHEKFHSSISQLNEMITNADKLSKTTEINKIKEEVIQLKNVIQSFNQLKKAIMEWEDKYVLKSNINGNVSFLNFWDENQTVSQGDLVFTIIPDDNFSLIAKLKISALKSGKIKKGQLVNVKLDHFPFKEYGVVKCFIQKISSTKDESGSYTIDVQLPDELISSYGKILQYKPEMTGLGEIVTEDLRLIERFLYTLK